MRNTLISALALATVWQTACQTSVPAGGSDEVVRESAGECPAPAADTAGWQLIERPGFSFRVPPDFEAVAVQGIDSQVEQYEAPANQAVVHLDRGWYSNDLHHDPDVFAQYESCSATIGGHPALVVTGVLRSDSAHAPHVAAATWRDVPALRGDSQQPVHLTMWGEVRDTTRMADVVAILHSVQFTP